MARRFAALVVVLVAAAAIGGPAEARSARELANLFACRAQQKTLAGAIAMWLADKKPGMMPVPRRITPADQEALRREGYIQSILHCPGHGPESADRYVQVPFPPEVVCLEHGAVDGTGSPRQQFERAGITDANILAAASRDPVPVPRGGFPWHDLLLTLLLVATSTTITALGRDKAGGPSVLDLAGWLLLFATVAGSLVPDGSDITGVAVGIAGALCLLNVVVVGVARRNRAPG